MWKQPVLGGVVLGVAFGTWDMAASARDPLSDDSPFALLVFYGPMFAAWAVAGAIAVARVGRLRDGLTIGALIGCATFAVFILANLVRVNVFLEVLRGRADWQRIVATFPNSGFTSFRAFVNYDYLTDAPFKLAVATTFGAVMGSVGGLMTAAYRLSRR